MTKCFINIEEGKYSGELKREVAEAIQIFLEEKGSFKNDGYKDLNSVEMSAFLNSAFPGLDWKVNSSQKAFDIYSVKAMIAIENKGTNVSKKKHSAGYTIKDKVMSNASIYPSYIKVKDVVAKFKREDYVNGLLESFMDVIVVGVERDTQTSKIARFIIVDGSYWGVSYEHYLGNVEYYKAVNECLPEINELIKNKNKDRQYLYRFIDDYATGKLPKIHISLRKLIFIDNPCVDSDYIEESCNV